MSITDQYAEFCDNLTFDDLPEPVVERTKQLTLDTLGIVIGSIRSESTESILQATRDRNIDRGGATVLATGERMGPEYASLVNGALAHSLDYDDTHREASLHPGAAVIPAALAASEEVDASGKEFVTAIVVGYEITCRMGMAVNPESHYDRGFHMTGTCGLFGATAAVGCLYGISKDEFIAAFGLNGSQAAGSLQFLENGGWNKRVHPGFAGHLALLSNSFAKHGFVSASEPIEGVRGFLKGYSDDPHPEKAVSGLGNSYEILDVGIKPYPCCRYMHAAIDIILELVKEEDITLQDIDDVTVKIPGPGIDIVGDPTNTYPQSLVDCQFSMPFGVALAIVNRDTGIESFFDAIEGDEVSDELKEGIDKTTVVEADWIERVYPDEWPAEVAITTDSNEYNRKTTYAKGEPENPLSWSEIIAKYDELVTPVFGENTARAVRETVTDIDSLSVSDLVGALPRQGREREGYLMEKR